MKNGKKVLRRYIDLPALIYMLKEKKITLLDPNFWDDRNDAHFLNVYKSKKNLKTLLAVCFTQGIETYHHWCVFASGSSGVCIEFKRKALIKEVLRCNGIKAIEVKYIPLKKAKNRKFETDQLPFIKRNAFKDDEEFRVIYESSEHNLPKKDISIPLSCIAKITLSPWAHKSLTDHVEEVLKSIDGCENIIIKKSELIESEKWKRIAELVV